MLQHCASGVLSKKQLIWRRAQLLLKWDHQGKQFAPMTFMICLPVFSSLPSGKKLLREMLVGQGLTLWCIFNHRLQAVEVSRLLVLLSVLLSVHIGRGHEADTTRTDFSCKIISPFIEGKDRAGNFSAMMVVQFARIASCRVNSIPLPSSGGTNKSGTLKTST